MDKIKIENLEIFANHGVFPEETKLGQKFIVSLTLYTDTRTAGLTDDLEKSIDYGRVSSYVTEFMKRNTCRLIESAAERLAAALLTDFSHLHRVRLEIKKPWAPIGLPLESVSVEIERGWHKAWLSIGSNMGDREAFLRRAVRELGELDGCRVGRVSEFLTTKPYGRTDQEDFLNACLELDTLLMPEELLEEIHEIEKRAGRERVLHWGPRTLDIDILFYDREVMETRDLVIPHADLQNRYFVLKPLSEIAPNLRHPVTGKTAVQMLGELE